MGLTQGEKATIEKARNGGSADLAVNLDDAACLYLLALAVSDLGLSVSGINSPPIDFFSPDPELLRIEHGDFYSSISRAVEANRDIVTYFSCLATLHKARLKFAGIVKHQPVPTMEQVGPRGLLQFGMMSPRALTGFLLWRKWVYDIDNRSAQETGYVFEPIIAYSIGGAPQASGKSPIKRRADPSKGRQVDCIARKRAYEFKLRVTIAASGQGRWGEELAFPDDCRASGFTPVLVVFDGTKNDKLSELQKAFKNPTGEAYVGEEAWKHLDDQAGPTMARFLDKYVRVPIKALLAEEPAAVLPTICLAMSKTDITVRVGDEAFRFPRAASQESAPRDSMPSDVGEGGPGL
jgi:hypothetical protein